MRKVEVEIRDIFLGVGAVILALLIAFGFGYFIGRAEQIELNKNSLKQISDINHCFESFSGQSVHGS